MPFLQVSVILASVIHGCVYHARGSSSGVLSVFVAGFASLVNSSLKVGSNTYRRFDPAIPAWLVVQHIYLPRRDGICQLRREKSQPKSTRRPGQQKKKKSRQWIGFGISLTMRSQESDRVPLAANAQMPA
ncbi:hypothetical protein I7I51_07037 [Histoplasma capsulatum]|uniref:Uncharacterized protein n=1 Tax=Ajellomyces capsulatus TaxID=5037 RepID=A0A8A1MN92_AJECA|nr:hypothetical protein I7I51_07037 [Histoplasma capsulatum]